MCNCHSYNMNTGDTPEVILSTPAQFGASKDICVDACIAHVIKELWYAGIWTVNSCCGHNKEAPSIIFSENLPDDKVEKIKKIISRVDDRKFQILSWKLMNCETGEKYS